MLTPLPFRQHVRAVLWLGLPLVGVHVSGFLVRIIDTLMLGRYDVEALAASVVAGGLYFVLFILLAGFGNAVMPIVAAAQTRDDVDEIRRATRMALWLSFGGWLVVLPILWFTDAILLALGQEDRVAELGGQYGRILVFAMLPMLVVNVLKSYLAALERTAVALWLSLGALALNAVLNYMLIFGNWGAPEMGIRGAGLASVISQLVSALLLLGYTARLHPEHMLFARLWRAKWSEARSVFRMGLPIGLQLIAEVGMFNVCSIFVGWIGVIELAAHGIALDITAIFFMLHLGFSQAATVRAGQSYGRGDRTNLVRGALTSHLLAMVIIVITTIVFLTLPDLLVGIFLSPTDPQFDAVLAVGVTLLAMAALFQFGDGIQVTVVSLLRGLHDMTVPLWITVVCYWPVGLGSAWLLAFPLGLGAVGVWLGLAAGLFAAAGLLSWRFWRVKVPSVGTAPA